MKVKPKNPDMFSGVASFIAALSGIAGDQNPMLKLRLWGVIAYDPQQLQNLFQIFS